MGSDSQRSLAWLVAIVQSSDDAILSSDENDLVTTWNPAAARLLGYRAEEIIGQSVLMIVPPELRAERRRFLDRLVLGDVAQGLDTKRRRKDGRLIDVEMTVSAVRDADGAFIGFSNILRDVGRRKAVEAHLRDLELRYRTFVEQMPALTYVHRPEGGLESLGLVHLSDRFEKVTGYPLHAWLDDPGFVYRIMHPEDRDRLSVLDKTIDGSREPHRSEFRLVAMDGEVVWVRDVAVLIQDDDGTRQYWLGFMFDISDQKRAEVETLAALAGQRALNAELERASNAKSQFLSMISHEFRTPLTSIQGFSELLIDETLSPDEVRAFAGAINASAQRLSRMITDLLDLDHLDSGQFSFVFGEIDLNRIAGDVIEALRPVTARHTFLMRFDSALPPIRGDADLLVRVLTNLVANSIKYSPDGGTITLATRQVATAVVLTVTDQGLGIPSEARESIFERYTRIDRPEQQSIEGTGLGLPIARQIVELHGGRLWVESLDGGIGSSFHMELPWHRQTPDS